MSDFIFGFCIGGILMMVISSFAANTEITSLQRKAIENGCAAYNSQTGKFEWGKK